MSGPRALRIVLLTPGFHGLYEAVVHAASSMGIEVVPVVYDARPGALAKVKGKLQLDLPERLGRDSLASQRKQATEVVRAVLRATDYDVLLAIKSDVVDPQLVIDERARGKRTVVWLYDALGNTHHTMESLSVFDVVASFSPSDVQRFSEAGWDARFVPLAADQRFVRPPSPVRSGPDVVFFGARYGQRQKMLSELHARGHSVLAYGRDWSRHPVDRIRTLTWRRPEFPTARELSRADVSRVAGSALGVVNMHNAGQDGFNLRTFEVPGAGGLQLTDRADIDQFFEPNTEVIVYLDLDDVDQCLQRARRDPRWALEVREAGWRRTLDQHLFTHRVSALIA